MATIPKHFKEAFPWISKSPSKIRIASKSAQWLEREIIYEIFRNPKLKELDPRNALFHSLEELCVEGQVNYINAVAKCLADAVIETPLPRRTIRWLKGVNAAAKKLRLSLLETPKQHLPASWNNLISIVIQIIRAEALQGQPISEGLLGALKKENLRKRADALDKHGMTDLVAILNIMSGESKDLSGLSAIAYYKFPQAFFEGISDDKSLFLAYQRMAILAISAVNQAHFEKPYDTLTAHILSCVFLRDISKQNIKRIREKLGH